jgi:hypothetical protein
VEPAHLALWAVPTAVCAWLIHNTRLVLLDRSLTRELSAAAADTSASAPRSATEPDAGTRPEDAA